MDYKQAGVDVAEGYKAVDKYKEHAARTRTKGVLTGLGSFNGMFAVPPGMREPVMVAGSDGVGTKLDVAFRMGVYDSVGIDCVAMCVNDILCSGVAPSFFLDYLACGKLDSTVAASLVKGVASGCSEAGCALLGGETAEMPGFYEAGKWDLAGFAVGVGEHSSIIDGSAVREGDVLVGLSSSGVHSNGFSLVRRLVSDFDELLDTEAGRLPIGQVLLEPTRIYVATVMDALEAFPHAIHAMSHITGGGFYENVPRMLPPATDEGQLTACIRRGSWHVPAIFGDLVRRGADSEAMFATFNMGIGFILAVDSAQADAVVARINERAPELSLPEQRKVSPVMRTHIIGYVGHTDKRVTGEVKGNRELVRFYE